MPPFRPVCLLCAPLCSILRAAVLPLAPVSTVDHSPRPIPLRLTDQSNRLAPLQPCPPALCSPCSAPPTLAVSAPRFPLQHSPTTISRSPLYSLPLVCAPHAHHQTRGHVIFPQHSSATRYLSSALFTFPSPAPSPPSSAPRVHGSTFHLPLDLLPSTPPLASDPSKPPKSVTTHTQ